MVAINNCVSKNRITGGILFWPDIARSNLPAVQHFDDDGFRGKFVNPFSHIQDRDLGVDTDAATMRFVFYMDSNNKQKMAQSFLPLYDIFKKRLGWTRPLFTAQLGPVSCDIAFYDAASEGKQNRWFEAKYSNFPVSKIKGAFVLIQNLNKPVNIQGSLNSERWWLGTMANDELKDLYKSCAEDPLTSGSIEIHKRQGSLANLTALAHFSTRMENLCDGICDTCEGYIQYRMRQAAKGEGPEVKIQLQKTEFRKLNFE